LRVIVGGLCIARITRERRLSARRSGRGS